MRGNSGRNFQLSKVLRNGMKSKNRKLVILK